MCSRLRPRAIRAIDERLQLLDDHPSIVGGFAAAKLRVLGRRVLLLAMNASVVDADDDQGLNAAVFDQLPGRLAKAPVLAFLERGLGLEQVLPVVHVQDGVTIGTRRS